MKAITLALFATLFSLSISASLASDFKLGALEITHPHARATPPNAPVSGGYLTIRNTGKEADRLISASADFAERAEIHEMRMDGDVMQMREIEDGLEIPAGGEVTLKPGGFHIMFIGLDGRLLDGETRPATLTFEKAGSIDLEFAIENVMTRKHDTGNKDHGATGDDAGAGDH